MKRAKDRWSSGYLAIGILFLSCLVVPHVAAVKATSLFRTTTTTTTTEAPEESTDPDAPRAAATAPPSNYTGIPQIDYVLDPNLPRELNGYNLSSYPFYETVPPPEEMDFKCDGLHDGFYASVAHKCQVYHHCLYGTRYDFLCANFTAFDQKTFICHFVSEVDCVNSAKYFHRNDALYQATTTSTAAPPPTTTTTTTPAPVRNRPVRRRLNQRRRPQFDYYDDEYYPSSRDEDYYEDDRRPYGEGQRGFRRRKRPRPLARRPVYDDEYEDDRYSRRPDTGRIKDDEYDDRRTYDRPRNGGRRPVEDRERPDSRKTYDDEDVRSYDRPRKPSRPSDDKRKSADSDRRPYERPRRPSLRDDDRREERPFRDDKVSNDSMEKDLKNYRDERPHRGDERPNRGDERPSRGDERPNRGDERPHRGDERPILRERPFREENKRPYKDDRTRNDDRRIREDADRSEESRSYGEEKKRGAGIEPTAGGALVKPNGASIYSKPRVAPKIARPVPSNEKDKFKYVTVSSTHAPEPIDEEYYDDYEDDPKSTSQSIKSSSYSKNRNEQSERDRFKPNVDRTRSNFDQDTPKRPLPGVSINYRQRKPEVHEDSYEEIEDMRKKLALNNRGRDDGRYSLRKRPATIEDDYYYEDEAPRSKTVDRRDKDKPLRSREYEKDTINKEHEEISTQKPFLSRTKETTTTTTTESSLNEKVNKGQGFVRVVKRPFLPSRGGSPYLPRGLQPLGGKNLSKPTLTTSSTTTTTTTTTQKPSQLDYSYETDYDIKDDRINERDPVENYSDEVDSGKFDLPDRLKGSKYTSEEKKYDYSQSTPQVSGQNVHSGANIDYKPQKESNSREKYSEKDESGDIQQYDTVPRPEHRNLQTQIKTPTEEVRNKEPVFIPSPQISDPYKPTNRPFNPKIPENISIKQNLADSIENDYDVTLNDALNPTLPNLTPVRNFPSPFINSKDRDYTFSRFQGGYQNPAVPSSQYNTLQQLRNQQSSNSAKYVAPQRLSGSYVKSQQPIDSTVAASEPVVRGVSVRTPQSYYIQQPRYSSSFSANDMNSGFRQSQSSYRQVNQGDYFV